MLLTLVPQLASVKRRRHRIRQMMRSMVRRHPSLPSVSRMPYERSKLARNRMCTTACFATLPVGSPVHAFTLVEKTLRSRLDAMMKEQTVTVCAPWYNFCSRHPPRHTHLSPPSQTPIHLPFRFTHISCSLTFMYATCSWPTQVAARQTSGVPAVRRSRAWDH